MSRMRALLTASAFCLLGCGATMLWVATNLSPRPGVSTINSENPKHPVTLQMLREAALRTRAEAPFFELPDSDGKPVRIGKPMDGQLQFVYFVADECPCSVDAEPLFQSLYKHFGKRVEFIAVSEVDLVKAKEWSFQMLMPYPLVPNADLSVMRAYGARNSVYSTLIDKDGRIVKQWPGYSREALTEMNTLMAEELGEMPREFATRYAPVKMASGCAFEIEWPQSQR